MKGRCKKESHPVEPYLEDEDLEKELNELTEDSVREFLKLWNDL